MGRELVEGSGNGMLTETEYLEVQEWLGSRGLWGGYFEAVSRLVTVEKELNANHWVGLRQVMRSRLNLEHIVGKTEGEYTDTHRLRDGTKPAEIKHLNVWSSNMGVETKGWSEPERKIWDGQAMYEVAFADLERQEFLIENRLKQEEEGGLVRVTGHRMSLEAIKELARKMTRGR